MFLLLPIIVCFKCLKVVMANLSLSDNLPTPTPGTQEKECGRKRGQNEESWKRNEAECKRNNGQPYRSPTTKKLVKAQEIGNPCKCKNRCFEQVAQAGVQSIFTPFSAIGNYHIQSNYTQKQVIPMDIKCKKTKAEGSRHSQTLVYCVTYGCKTHKVC